ncbi:MAG: T9SS type A sorting domain-containing protein [Sphingobacteriales bacterium]|nr:MAG: T9SS type A sorting domain-containing protein [Sphingobacteriales bacterium]
MSVITLKETLASKEAEMSTMWNDYKNEELLLTSYSMKFLPSKATFFYFDMHRVGGLPKESDFGNVLTMLSGEEVPYEFRISSDIVSNDPESEQPYITVAPNPGSDVSKVIFSRGSDVDSRIVMYNVLGQTVREFKNLEKDGERELHLDELASGSYVIIMYTGEEKYSKQFVIQK